MTETVGMGQHDSASREFAPAMSLGGEVTEAGAIWVGACGTSDLEAAPAMWRLEAGDDFTRARFLVRDGDAVRGFITLPVRREAGRAVVEADLARQLARQLPDSEKLNDIPLARGLISVVICTRDRADSLREALGSVLRCRDDHFEVLVVDNGSSGPGTREVVAEFQDSRVRLVAEPVPGLARARNRGAVEAKGDFLAFTDDDVVVDERWLLGVRRGFGRSSDVGCVSGLVPAGELRTATQRWFEDRVTWGSLVDGRIYRISESPADVPLFPFQFGLYGTGANMTFRRELFLQLGADEALGAGTPAKGGEDLDLFLRALLSKAALVIEPSALIWHRHRSNPDDLDSQVVGYGRGLGAFLGKLLTRPEILPLVLRRTPHALLRLRSLGGTVGTGRGELATEEPLDAAGMSRLARTEFRSLLAGPWYYARSRRERAVPPLLVADRGPSLVASR